MQGLTQKFRRRKIVLLRMILHEGVQKKYSREFRRVSEKLYQFYFYQVNSKKKMDGAGN